MQGVETPIVFGVLQSNLFGFRGAWMIADTNTSSNGPIFYRVGIQEVFDGDED